MTRSAIPPAIPVESDPVRLDWHYHFLGIGGIGMSALAELLHGQGVRVSGSDTQSGPVLERLAALGIPVAIEHKPGALEGADAVVYSSAVLAEHPIWAEVRRRGLPRLHRAALLGALAAPQRTLAVTGTHGKTTSTGALAQGLAALGWRPTALVGGHLPQWEQRNFLAGAGEWLVCEADESDGSFVHLAPEAVLLTNVEADHLDFHGTLANLRASFAALLGRIRPGGCLVWCAEDAEARQLAAGFAGRAVSYGFADSHGPADPHGLADSHGFAGADVTVRIEGKEPAGAEPGGTRLRLQAGGESFALTTPLLGRHNALNLCGAFALGRAVGAPGPALAQGLAGFRGVARRQQLLGRVAGLTVYDDYAHHPTEIRATLAAFQEGQEAPVTIVFQPHLYSRTAHFAAEFAAALRPAARVYVTEVYGAREAPVEGISGRMIVERMAGHPAALFVPHWSALPALLRADAPPPGVLLTVGAGDITGLGPLLLRELA